MTRTKEYEFVFGDMTVKEFIEIDGASRESRETDDFGPILEVVNKYLVGDIYSFQMLELPNILEQFNEEFADYFNVLRKQVLSAK